MLKISSKPIAEHAEVPLADDGDLEALVHGWNERHERTADPSVRAVYVVSVGRERDERARNAQLSEIIALVKSQGSRVVGMEIVHVSQPNPRTFLGKGGARDIADRARAAGATMLVVDAELSPSQQRNLEDTAGIAVCDREAVILEVFLRHARTRRAKIQVEIARLQYLRPRIRGIGLDMDQQVGGANRARGPGETASELLARKLDARLAELDKARRKIESSARTQRRQRESCRRIALVGYTNAGKTSLMNALTDAALSARDMPFETLDTTSRCLARHGGEVILSDTVGFVRRLPERLLASFESTLVEVIDASLLVLVVDVSDDEADLHLETTLRLVEKLGAGDVPRFYVFNKIDRLESAPRHEELAAKAEGHPFVALSTRDGAAVHALEAALLSAVRQDEEDLTAFFPFGARSLFSLAYAKCRVTEGEATEAGVLLHVRGARAVIARIRCHLAEMKS